MGVFACSNPIGLAAELVAYFYAALGAVVYNDCIFRCGMYDLHTLFIVFWCFCGIDDDMFEIGYDACLFEEFLTFLDIVFGESDKTKRIFWL